MTGASETTQAPDRRLAWLMAATSAALFMVLASVLLPWDALSVRTDGVRVGDYFTAQQLAAAEDYANTVRPLSWASYAVSLAIALALGLTRLGPRLMDRLGVGRWWLVVLIGSLALLLLGRLVTLPFALLVRAERLEVGLTEQGLVGWLGDRVTSLFVSWVIVSLVLLLVVGLARWSPRWWFLWASGGLVALVFAGSFLYPVAVEPLFNRFEPLDDGALRTAVLTLAESEGVKVDEVLVADASRRTTTLNAYVSGLGGTRRVVLYDNLLEQPPEQVVAVVAHELAHVRHGDVLIGTLLGAVGGVLGLSLGALLMGSARVRMVRGLGGAGDPRTVPFMLALFAVAGLVVSPVENSISRMIEVRADRTALAATDDPGTFIEMQQQLALRSLADPTPPAWSQVWFGSHPTVRERIALARELEDAG